MELVVQDSKGCEKREDRLIILTLLFMVRTVVILEVKRDLASKTAVALAKRMLRVRTATAAGLEPSDLMGRTRTDALLASVPVLLLTVKR